MGLVADDYWGHAMDNGSVVYRPDSRRRNSSPCSMNSDLTGFSERTGSSQPDFGDLCDIDDSWCNSAKFNNDLQPDFLQHGDLTANSRSDHLSPRSQDQQTLPKQLSESNNEHPYLALVHLTPREKTLLEHDKLKDSDLNKGTIYSNTTYGGATLLPSWSEKYQLTDGKSRKPQPEIPSRSPQTNQELPPPRPSKPGKVKVSPSIKRKQTQTKEFWSPLLTRENEFPPKTTQEIKTPPKFPEAMNQPQISSKSTETLKQQSISLKTTQLNNPPPTPPKQDEKTLPKKLSNLNNELSNIASRKQQPLRPETTEMSNDQQIVPKQLPESKNEPPNLPPFIGRRDQPPLPPKPSETIKFSQDQQTLPKQLSESNNEPPYLPPIIVRRDQPPLPPKPSDTIKFSSKHNQQTLPKQLLEPRNERQISPRLPAIPQKSTDAVRPPPVPPIQTLRTHQIQPPELNNDPQNLPLLPPREQPPALPQRLNSTAAESSSDDETTPVAPFTPSSPRNPSIQNPNPRHRGSGVRELHCILQRRTLTVVSVSSFLISILSIALLVLVQINPFVYSWKDRTFKQDEYKTCVTCVSLMSNIASYMFDNDLKSLDSEFKEGELFCCAKNNNQMSSLLKLVIKQQDYKPSAGNSDSNEAIINDHVVLDPQTHGFKKDMLHNYPMRIRSTDSETSKATEKDFFLTISVSGWYYVYSSIFYNTNCSNQEFKTLEHFIVRFKPHDKAKTGPLTFTVHTCCKNCVNEKRSIFTGGVFELFKGDQLSASVNNIAALHHDNEPSSYLGYSMLGE